MTEIFYNKKGEYIPQFFDNDISTKDIISPELEIYEDDESLYDYNEAKMYELFYDNDNPLYDMFNNDYFSVEIDFDNTCISIEEKINITKDEIKRKIRDFIKWIEHKIYGRFYLYMLGGRIFKDIVGEVDIDRIYEYDEDLGWYSNDI